MNTKKNAVKSKARNGDGSIFAQTNKNGTATWKAEMSLGKKANGKRRKTRRSFRTYQEAKKGLAEMRTAYTSGHLTEIRNDTVDSYGMRWTREVMPLTIRETTAADYQDRLQRYVFPYLGTIRMVDLRTSDVVRWLNELKKVGKSTNTINGARRVLFGMCKHAAREGLISVNPIQASDAVRRQAGEKTQVREPWSLDEAKAVLRCADKSDALDAFLHIMLNTGMRPGEALGLRWEDLDFKKSELSVTGTLKSARRITPLGAGIVRLERNDPKTKASRRTITIPENLVPALNRQLLRQSMWRVREGSRWQETGFVVTSMIGTPVSSSNLRKKFIKLLSQNEIRYIRLHDIRHSVVTICLNLGIPLDQVSQVVGHSSLSITKDIYGGYIKRHTENLAKVLGEALLPLPTEIQPFDRELVDLMDGPVTSRKVVKINGATKKTKSRTHGTDR